MRKLMGIAEAKREAEKNAREALMRYLAKNGDKTAYEISEETGISSMQVVGIITNCECNLPYEERPKIKGKRMVGRQYARVLPNGEVDMSDCVIIGHKARVYGV
jgi:hypothetical protein